MLVLVCAKANEKKTNKSRIVWQRNDNIVRQIARDENVSIK